MVETDKEIVKFVEVRATPDGRTKIYFSKLLRRADKKEKLWSGAAFVGDENLLKKLKNLKTGAEIEIETATDWDKDEMPVYLVDFRICAERQPEQKGQNRQAKNATTGELVLT